MGQAQRKTTPETQNQSDRREMARYDTSIKVDIRFMPDGAPISGSAIEIGPNGIRVVTALPLVEATYLHITFKSASNNTHCEGRVVWTQHSEDEVQYESGVDIQKWGGGIPGHQEDLPHPPPPKLKRDRRKKRR